MICKSRNHKTRVSQVTSSTKVTSLLFQIRAARTRVTSQIWFTPGVEMPLRLNKEIQHQPTSKLKVHKFTIHHLHASMVDLIVTTMAIHQGFSQRTPTETKRNQTKSLETAITTTKDQEIVRERTSKKVGTSTQTTTGKKTVLTT